MELISPLFVPLDPDFRLVSSEGERAISWDFLKVFWEAAHMFFSLRFSNTEGLWDDVSEETKSVEIKS